MVVQDGAFLSQVDHERESGRKGPQGAVDVELEVIDAVDHVALLTGPQAVEGHFMQLYVQALSRGKPHEIASQLFSIPDGGGRKRRHHGRTFVIKRD